MREFRSIIGRCSVAIGMLTLVFFNHPVHAEWYVAGQGGVSFSNSLNNGEGVGSLAGFSISDLDLHKSPMYGAKVGYYFDSMKWLGVEMEAFSSTPHLKQQTAEVRFGGDPATSATGTLPGQDLRVTNWAPINVMFRYQMGPVEPYAGVGLGVFLPASTTVPAANRRPPT